VGARVPAPPHITRVRGSRLRVRSPAKMSEALALAAKADFASDARRARGASKEGRLVNLIIFCYL
jgi:hypothetical protein